MKTLLNLLIVALVLALAALAFVNVGVLMQPVVIDLVVTEASLPLGATLIGLAGVLALLFAAASAGQQLGAARERKRLMDEQRRLQALADQAEASRLEALRKEMTDEFRRLNDRLSQGVRESSGALLPPGD